jgi:hypothetical protein
MPLTFITVFTSPVNPPGATPVLSHAQVWKAFLLKAEHPQRFVPAIEECEIVERRVIFAASMGAGMMSGAQLEDVEFVGDMRVRPFSSPPPSGLTGGRRTSSCARPTRASRTSSPAARASTSSTSRTRSRSCTLSSRRELAAGAGPTRLALLPPLSLPGLLLPLSFQCTAVIRTCVIRTPMPAALSSAPLAR